MYAVLNMGVMPAYPMLSQCFTSIGQHSLSFHSKTLQNSNKFRINSNKLGQMRIKLEQAVSKAS